MFIYDHLHQYVDLHFPSKYLHHYLEPYFRKNRTYFRSRFMLFGPQIRCVIFLNSSPRLAASPGWVSWSPPKWSTWCPKPATSWRRMASTLSPTRWDGMPCHNAAHADCRLMPLSCEDMSDLKKAFLYRVFRRSS